jgi:hypothetical protein
MAAAGGDGKGLDRFGWLLLVVGLALLATALGLTARQIGTDPPPCQAPAGKPAAIGAGEALIAVNNATFRLGTGICLGINLPKYFAAERAEPVAGPESRIRTVQIFFGDTATPATMPVNIDDDGGRPATDPWQGWVWKQVPLRTLATANTDIGKRWRALSTMGGPGASKQVLIGLGDKPGNADASLPHPGAVIATPITLLVFNPMIVTLGGVGLLLAAAGVVMASWHSRLLRDVDGATGPFSLGRVQMAFWLLLSIAGFLAIWLVTGLFNGTITDGLLTLLGISVTSGLSARVIDANSPARPSGASKGFLIDILSENHGTGSSVALHRLQMVLWTLILGLVYVWTIFSQLTLPDFDTNLLLMVGISSGTYIGFKFPEAMKATPPAATADAPADAPAEPPAQVG